MQIQLLKMGCFLCSTGFHKDPLLQCLGANRTGGVAVSLKQRSTNGIRLMQVGPSPDVTWTGYCRSVSGSLPVGYNDSVEHILTTSDSRENRTIESLAPFIESKLLRARLSVAASSPRRRFRAN
jgi:hypothetical protein